MRLKSGWKEVIYMKKVNNSLQNRKHTQKIVGISVFSALAFVVALVCNVIPPVAGFLSLDAKDAVISIAAFIYGPISGVIIAFIAALIEFLTFSTTAWYGFLMNFASSAVFSLSAAAIYKLRRTQSGALAGLLCAVVTTTAVMLLLNNFVTPIYLRDFVGMPESAATQTVIELLPTVLLPFNFAKALLNTGITIFLYKPIISALRRTGLVAAAPRSSAPLGKSAACGTLHSAPLSKVTTVMILVGSLALILAVTVLIVIS